MDKKQSVTSELKRLEKAARKLDQAQLHEAADCAYKLKGMLAKVFVGTDSERSGLYSRAYEIFVDLWTRRLEAEWEKLAEMVEGWVGNEVTLVSLHSTKPICLNGTLYFGPAHEEIWGDFRLVTATKVAEFEWLQIADAVITPNGMRILIADSPHCGIGYPVVRPRADL